MMMLASLSVFADSYPVASLTSGPDRWQKKRIRVEISNSLLRSPNSIKPESDVQSAIAASFEAWTAATGIEFEYSWSDRSSVSAPGRAGDGLNLITIAATPENMLAIGASSGQVPAQTRVFYGRRGEIAEADIVLNPIQQFSTDGSFGTFDLQSTLTHEIGHLLGLEHSPIVGATMYELQARNGFFGLPGYSKRSLSDDDLSAIRARYSVTPTATVSGRALVDGGRGSGEFAVWAVDQSTGRVVAGRFGHDDGSYAIDGLETGDFEIFAQSCSAENDRGFAGSLGVVQIRQTRAYRLEPRVLRSFRQSIDGVGFNGQFGDLPIVLNPGGSFMMNATGKGLASDSLVISTSTSGIEIGTAGMRLHRLGTSTVIADFSVSVADSTAFGEYVLEVAVSPRERRYFVGALSVESFPNPWTFYDLK